MCLSTTYVNKRTKLLWRCSEGHEWETKPDTVQGGSWCPDCGGKKRLTIRHMQTWAKKRGGVCVSTVYSDAHTKLRWRCQEGHEWEAAPSPVKLGGWCPTCSQGNSERIVRDICKQMFGKPFPKAKPTWLINARGNLMELDGYCSKLSLAFEYQGIQHYEVTKFSRRSPMRRTLTQQKRDDARKRRLCRANGVHLIAIPYTVELDDVPAYIFTAVKDLSVPVRIRRPEKIKVAQFVLTGRLRAMQALARERGGECLSIAYLRTHAKLRWRCSEGHEWLATSSAIKNRGNWCPFCAGKAPLTLGQMQVLARTRGGECLSTTYVNNHTKLLWRCSEGHEWEAKPADVKNSGSWCPDCARSGSGLTLDARRQTLEWMQTLAIDRGGECLSPRYVNNHTKLLWRCQKGHEWEAKPHDITQGTWCPTCAGRPRITLGHMQALAKKHGGQCLSTVYVNSHTKLRWRCQDGHEWEAGPKRMQQRVNWCLECRRVAQRRAPA